MISKEEIKRVIDDIESKEVETIEEFRFKSYVVGRLGKLLAEGQANE